MSLLHFLHIGPTPITAAGVDTTNQDVHPFGLVYPGQVIQAETNPNPAAFTQVWHAPSPAPDPAPEADQPTPDADPATPPAEPETEPEAGIQAEDEAQTAEYPPTDPAVVDATAAEPAA